jgi:sigma-E factor negative regulatory protein RseB
MRFRLLAGALAGGVLLTAAPALAEVDAGRGASSAEAGAVDLLEQAADAGRRLTYRGTQYVASWRGDTTSSALVDLEHDPATGSVVSGDSDVPVASTALLDPRMLTRLAATYDLRLAGPGRCAGREAAVVEARDSGGRVAGRFWVDRESGVLLRRDVFDGEGRRIRSSAFVDLAVSDRASGGAPLLALQTRTGVERPAPQAVERLRRGGWQVPDELPHGFRLFETRLSDGVLHLAYTDGLSTLSLFAQSGELGSAPMDGFSAEQVEGRPVWVRHAAPERVVWSGGGSVWTLVSDAPSAVVRAAVATLPRDPAPETGLTARLGRGLARLGGMLNPFD